MKRKTWSIYDIALDWAVTTIADPKATEYGVTDWREQRRSCVKGGEYLHRYTQSWAQAGQLIDEHRICLEVGHDGVWLAYTKQNYIDAKEHLSAGSTATEAAMRCLVLMKLGETVEIPEELT